MYQRLNHNLYTLNKNQLLVYIILLLPLLLSFYLICTKYTGSIDLNLTLLVDSSLLLFVSGLSSQLIHLWKKGENYKKQLENEKSLMELNLLKNQINPHFIFNTLNNIYSLSISNRNGIPDAILRLSSILRYMLYECDRTMFKLEEELKVIEDYIQLQKLRLNDRVNVDYKLSTEPGEYFIEPLLIITLIENAFKYGADTNSDSRINIDLCVLNGRLSLNIKNKILHNTAQKKDSCGIGLKNIKRRLDLIYPNQYYYNVKIEDSDYSVYLELEL